MLQFWLVRPHAPGLVGTMAGKPQAAGTSKEMGLVHEAPRITWHKEELAFSRQFCLQRRASNQVSLALVGPTGCGKTTALARLCSELGAFGAEEHKQCQAAFTWQRGVSSIVVLKLFLQVPCALCCLSVGFGLGAWAAFPPAWLDA